LKEVLLASRENEGGAAIAAIEYFIDVGHDAYLMKQKFDSILDQ
jgi:hypothetical protein